MALLITALLATALLATALLATAHQLEVARVLREVALEDLEDESLDGDLVRVRVRVRVRLGLGLALSLSLSPTLDRTVAVLG